MSPLMIILPSLALILLLVLLMWRQSQERRTSVRMLWARILIVTILWVLSFSYTIIGGTANIALLVVCGIIGLIIGIASARLSKLQPDIANRALLIQGTTWSLAIWSTLFVIDQGARLLSKDDVHGMLINLIGANALLLMTSFVLGMHLCWYWRYSQLRRASLSTQ